MNNNNPKDDRSIETDVDEMTEAIMEGLLAHMGFKKSDVRINKAQYGAVEVSFEPPKQDDEK